MIRVNESYIREANDKIKWELSYDGLDEEDIEEGNGWYVATLGENPKNGNRCFASIGFSSDYADVEVWINGSFGNYTLDKREGKSASAMKSYVQKNLSNYLGKLERWDDNY